MTYHSVDTTTWDAAIEMFAGFVTQAFQNTDLFGTDKMMFAGRSVGETFNYPVMQTSEAFNQADGNEIDTTTADIANDILTTELPVDLPLKDYRLIPQDQIEIRPDLRLPENFAVMLGRSIARGKHIRLQNMLATAASQSATGGHNVHEVNTNFANLGQQLKDVFDDIGGQMDEDGVPSEGRHIFLRSTLWYSLIGVEGIIRRDFGGQANVRTAGGVASVVEYANFTIWNSPIGFGTDFTGGVWDNRISKGSTLDTSGTAYHYDATNLVAVAWQEEAWALRHWVEPTTMVERVPMRNSWKAESRLTMGAAVIQGEGVHIIDDVATS